MVSINDVRKSRPMIYCRLCRLNIIKYSSLISWEYFGAFPISVRNLNTFCLSLSLTVLYLRKTPFKKLLEIRKDSNLIGWKYWFDCILFLSFTIQAKTMVTLLAPFSCFFPHSLGCLYPTLYIVRLLDQVYHFSLLICCPCSSNVKSGFWGKGVTDIHS